MKKKLQYKHSSLVYTTDLSSTMIRDDSSVDWEAYCLIDHIQIDERDDIRIVFSKLLGQAITQILQTGEIYVRLYLNTTGIDQILLDDYKLIIFGLGFDQVSSSNEGIMFVFGND